MLVLLSQYCVAIIFTASTLCMSRGRLQAPRTGHVWRYQGITIVVEDFAWRQISYCQNSWKIMQRFICLVFWILKLSSLAMLGLASQAWACSLLFSRRPQIASGCIHLGSWTFHLLLTTTFTLCIITSVRVKPIREMLMLSCLGHLFWFFDFVITVLVWPYLTREVMST
jgi:hypothetical protein